MGHESGAALKRYFHTGAVPTQDHFADLIDSCLNKKDARLYLDTRQQFGLGAPPTATLSVQSQYNLPLRGSISAAAGSTAIIGKDTYFLSALAIGSVILVNGSLLSVAAIADDTHLTIATAVVASLALSNADGTCILKVDPGGALCVQDSVSAGSFIGSGASLTGIPASALTGMLAASQLPAIPAGAIDGVLGLAQLPPIPASQLAGQLAVAQVPNLQTRDVTLYTANPVVSAGTRVTITYLAQYAYDLTLQFVTAAGPVVLTSLQGIGPGSKNFQIVLSQTTLFTLTATLNGAFFAQRQVWLTVA